MHLSQVQNLLVSNCRGGESPLVMELGTPGCTGLKSTILAMLFTIRNTMALLFTTMVTTMATILVLLFTTMANTMARPCKVSTMLHLLPTLLLILPAVKSTLAPRKISSSTSKLMHLLPTLLLILPAVTADTNSFTMSAGLVDFRLQLAFINLHYQTQIDIAVSI